MTMNRVKSIIISLLAGLLLIPSCETEKAPYLSMTGIRSLEFPKDGGSQVIAFTCNRPWRVSSSESWAQVSPPSGIAADGDIIVTITVSSNTTYDVRSANLTVEAEDMTEEITVSQAAGTAFIVSPTSYELTNDAQTIEVTVEQNVNYTVEIEESSKSWIEIINSKGLTTDKVLFSIAANAEYDPREGSITFMQSGTGIKETVTVRQSQNAGLIVTPTEFELSSEEQSFEVSVAQNVPFCIVIPDDAKDWVSVLSDTQTKALTEETIVLHVSENTRYETREASVTFEQLDGTLSQTVSIRQSESTGLFVTTPEYQLSNSAHVLDVEVKANVEFEAVPQADWISFVQTKALAASTITLSIEANDSYDSRTGTVLVKQKNGNLTGTITVTQAQSDGLTVTPTEFSLSYEAQAIEVLVQNNVPFSVVIPDESKGWISLSSSTQTRSLKNDYVILSIAANDGNARSSSVTIKQNDGPLAQTLRISQSECPPETEPKDGFIVVGYATYWDSTMPDPSLLTHINYSFAHIKDDFETLDIKSPSRLSKMIGLKSQNPKLKVLLSVGGWEAGNFSEMAASETHRKAFCSNCAAAVKNYNLDGIDLDWEYPTSSSAGISSSPDDTRNFTLLVRDLKYALGKGKLVTMASASSAKYIDWQSALPYLDWVNVMTYDMGKPPYHNAALYSSSMTQSGDSHNCDGSVGLHVGKGVPYDKIVMGIPFFGRIEGGDEVYYNEIDYTGLTSRWDDTAKVPYLVNSSGKMVLTYDDETSVGLKAEYVKQKDLRGAMYWNIEADDANWTLSKAIAGPLLGWTDPNAGQEPDTFLATNQYVQKFLEEVNYPETNKTDTDEEYYNSLIIGYPGGGPSNNNEEIPPTYTINWTAGSGKQTLKVWDGDWSREYSLSSGITKQDITNLVPNTTYYWQVTNSKNQKVDSGSFKTTGLLHQVFFTPNVRNARDLGGYKGFNGKTVAYRKLYRGGGISSSYLNSSGKKEMLAEGIKAEVDLREAEDVPSSSPLGSGVAFYAPGFDSGYNHMVRDNPAKVCETFRWIVARLREGKPVYFHCAAGRDRTGTMAVLLLGALGVGESDMAKDYELTYFSPEDWSLYEDRYQHTRDNYSYKSVRKTIFKEITSGTYQERIVNYLLKIGVPQNDIDDYQSIMLH